jgi:hypothetical protein
MQIGREYSEVELKDLFKCRSFSGVATVIMDERAQGAVIERKADPNDVMSDTFYTRVK